MPTVSLTMIVRDEAANLPACLASCEGLFDEIIIVDTGSTDSTKAIAAAARDKHGRPAKVFDFTWCDDFAAARNESLRHATGDWVFWMDADDRLDEESRGYLTKLLPLLDDRNIAYAFDQLSEHPSGRATVTAKLIRLFARSPEIHWEGEVHEELCAPPNGIMAHTGVFIRHVGYRDPQTLRRKAARDLPLLCKRIEADPCNVALMRWAAIACEQLGRGEEAKAWVERAVPSLKSTLAPS